MPGTSSRIDQRHGWPNPALHSDPACIAFRSLSSSRFLGFVQRLGAGVAGELHSLGAPMNLVADTLMTAIAGFILVIDFVSIRSGVLNTRFGGPIKRKEEPYKFFLFMLITFMASCLMLWFALPEVIKGFKRL